ncbi:MAG: methyltransferase [Candidatus Sericytochromatia bacterium]|nr:methyltransferase [Candidatus Sericytochromatia bacterium]
MQRVERGLVVVAWTVVLVGAIRAWGAAPGLAPALLVLFQGVVLWQFLRRLPARDAASLPGTLLAFAGTAAPLLFRPARTGPPDAWSCLWPVSPAGAVLAGIIQVAALLLMVASVAALGRSFGIRPARRRLVTRGPYAAMRHPLYVAEWLCGAGLCLVHPSPGNLTVLVLTGALLVARAHLEERVLAGDPGWAAYRHRVPAGPWRAVKPPVT